MTSRLATAAVTLTLMATLALATATAAAEPPTAVAAALADAGRPAKDTALDASRRPADMVVFARIKAGDTVMDVWPGGGYWTRIFSKLVGPQGKVFAYVPAETTSFKPDPMAVARSVAAEPGRGNVTVVSDPLAAPPQPSFYNAVDVVWTFENYHDFHDSFMKGADVAAFNAAVFKLLKPGGYYVIVDHAAPAGSGLKNTEDLHRIDPATLRAEVETAGFVFDGDSTVLANPADPKTALVYDASIRGKTDRFAYRFRKP